MRFAAEACRHCSLWVDVCGFGRGVRRLLLLLQFDNDGVGLHNVRRDHDALQDVILVAEQVEVNVTVRHEEDPTAHLPRPNVHDVTYDEWALDGQREPGDRIRRYVFQRKPNSTLDMSGPAADCGGWATDPSVTPALPRPAKSGAVSTPSVPRTDNPT